jgi:hypothetical protein
MFGVQFFMNRFSSAVLVGTFALPPGLSSVVRDAFAICGRVWAIWAIAWLLMAFFSKSNKRRESSTQRLQHIVPAMLGFLLIFREDFG